MLNIFIAEEMIFYFSFSASFKKDTWYSITFISVNRSCLHDTVCQPFRHCHCTPTGTEEVNGTAVE